MIKEFKIKDILNAVDSIYEIQRKKEINIEVQNDLLANNQGKSNNSEILVLNQMIE
tara:strand:- start:929 stop:1096 length:168 start_codon:yes stop_codon:yes gene_type:complete